MSEQEDKLGDMKRRLGRIGAVAKATVAAKKDEDESIGIEDIKEAAKTVNGVARFMREASIKAVQIGKFLFGWTAPAGRWYMKNIWDKYAYKDITDPPTEKLSDIFKKKRKTGERVFSRKRAGAVIMATATAVAALTPSAVPVVGDVGDVVRETVNEAVVLPALMVTTGRTETLYASSVAQTSQDQNADIFRVRASTSQTSTEDNALQYEIRPALIHRMLSPFYSTRTVASAIPPGETALCEAFTYGLRDRFSQAMGWQPIWYKGECTRIADAPAPVRPAS